MKNHEYTNVTLPNGLTVIIVPQADAYTATVLVLVETGSKYETKKLNGISHFLEHMCFKGTKKRPRSIDISSELDALGASYNAFTGHEYTGYYAKVDAAHLFRAIDIVSDIYINQIFRKEELKKESGVIIEEINMYEDDPKRKIHDDFTALLYGDQPAGWNIAGTKESVLSITTDDLRSYHDDHYVARGTTVIVSGKCDPKNVLEEVKKRFKTIRTKPKKSKLPTKDVQKKEALAIHHRKTDQTHAIIGFRSYPSSHKKVITLHILSTILGGGMSSRLFSVIREKMGAAYYVSSFTDEFTDHGYFAISVGSNNAKIKNVISAILLECRRLKEKPVSQKELRKVKDYMIGKLAIGLETSDSLGWYYGMQYVQKKRIDTPEAFMKKINSISAKDIQNVAREIFQKTHLNAAIIGPATSKVAFVPLLKV